MTTTTRKRPKADPKPPPPEPSPDVILFRKLHDLLHSLTFGFDYSEGEFVVTSAGGFLGTRKESRSAVSFRDAALKMLTDLLPIKIDRLDSEKRNLAKQIQELEALKLVLEQETSRKVSAE